MNKVSKEQGNKQGAVAIIFCFFIGISTIGWVACNTAKADDSAQDAGKASFEATKIYVMQTTWQVTSADTAYINPNENGWSNNYKIDLVLTPDWPYEHGPLTCEVWSTHNDFGEYRILWRELMVGSEVEFDFHENEGATEVTAYLIPRLTSDSPRQVQ